ncbi:MAG: addiction module protein [Ignavibacteria bacterium]|nr:addiction module protein [Ignavibacteria bacterium]MDP3830537.1 addiction module protein [Ignavibacteriaceae bacterium]
MTIQHIEKQALKLDVNSRAKLASALLSSLDDLSESENEKLWAEEALLRHNEMIKDKTKAKPAKLVLKNARARIK